ncbi:MAG: hypothetical protein WDN24_17105 [Sphingomonas sp.]
MTRPSQMERSSFVVDPRPFVGPATYTAVGQCSYFQESSMPGAPTRETDTITVRNVRDRLLVTIIGLNGTSTALIGPDGKLHSFNLVDANGVRRTRENAGVLASEEAERYRAQLGRSAHSVNSFSSVYPHYIKLSWVPGDIVAQLNSEDEILWASHIYRGLTVYKGRSVALIDIVRIQPGSARRGPLVVGWSLVDPATMAPLLFTLDSGAKVRIERISCS